ncbi:MULTISPECIES: tRNA dihydrouridine synthase DusB [Gammaproteobacteria]|uniref:tRNA dihydrouridine synthase DusB n=1 Tax=Gammaproteobacteria TaxID=1236 RepID=UPI000DCF9F57|nr:MULTISPECIES: tRNA dihydrouridine synthase DusB [Gammaproteobacteria]RTE85694.1 tRNA dihydrouridine synthase DusB [Aliidiomarina sp. B3213]TCZ90305.1 tRNA dihydrouridine synthase DusB [Lysobacter sp. N42]
MRIGSYELKNNVILAPMAGVTDLPFRRLCVELGAGLAVSEMLSSNPKVWDTAKSKNRMAHHKEPGLRSVQIAGSDPELMARAAQHNVVEGAQIIDINMGCPAKKVNKKLAGSALLQEPELVRDIISAVVAAVDVPVTLKIRTGWAPEHRNGVQIAEIAEREGIQALTVHGRTRACMYKGHAEYETIKNIREAIQIPLIANGDITSPEKALEVLEFTQADAVMVGRGAQGNPWIFREITHFFQTGEKLPPPEKSEVIRIMGEHLKELHAFYGEHTGVRIARKHIGWYVQGLGNPGQFRAKFNALETSSEQLEALNFLSSI